MTDYQAIYETKKMSANDVAARVENGWLIGMDAAIAQAEWFACTDGTATCFVKIRTQDLLNKYLEEKELSLI